MVTVQKFKRLISENIDKFGMIVALIGITLIFTILTGGIILTPLNITNIIMQNSYILILAIGMVLVIMTGEIDLSVGSVAAITGAISAILMVRWDVSVFIAIPISLLVGALIGAWHGWWVAYVGLPAFIVTLAGMLLFRGLTLILLEGRTLAPYPDSFRVMSASYLPDFFNGDRYHITTIIIGIAIIALYIFFEIKSRKQSKELGQKVISYGLFISKVAAISIVMGLFISRLAAYAGIPYILFVLMVLIIGYTFFTNRTISGRHIYATGGNEKAALLSGVQTKKVKFWVFVNMGVLSALSGMVFAGRLNAATPQAGNLFELDAIAAAVIGGASLSGGSGTVVGAIIGALIMGILDNGMSILGVGVDWQQAIKALVLLGAVAFDILNKKRKSRS